MAKQILNNIKDAAHPAGDNPGPAGVLASYNGNVDDANANFTELYDDKAPKANPVFTGLVTTPAIKVTGGVPGAGKVLTSDADGDATWQDPAAGAAAPATAGLVASTGAPGAALVDAATQTDAVRASFRDDINAIKVVNVKDYGAVGNGVANDYAALVAAYAALTDGSTLYFPPGTYYVDRYYGDGSADLTISGRADIHVLGYGAKIKLKTGIVRAAGTVDTLVLLYLRDCRRATVEGIELDGSVDTHTQSGQPESAHGHNLVTSGCDAVTLLNVYSHHAAADGYLIGAGLDADGGGAGTLLTACKNITMRDCRANACGRQGLTIRQAQHVKVLGGVYENTRLTNAAGTAQNANYTGHAPGAGIDIEPSYDTDSPGYQSDVATGYITLDGVTVRNNYLNNTVTTGQIQAAPPSTADFSDVLITNCTILSGSGAQVAAGFTSAILIGGPRVTLQNSTIDGEKILLKMSASDKVLIQNNTIRTASTGIEADNSTTGDVQIEGNYIVGAHAAAPTNFLKIVSPRTVFRNNRIFLPAAIVSGGSFSGILLQDALEVSGNIWETDYAGTTNFYQIDARRAQSIRNETFRSSQIRWLENTAVDGNPKSTVRTGQYIAERTFYLRWNTAAANQFIELQFPVSSQFGGVLEIEYANYYQSATTDAVAIKKVITGTYRNNGTSYGAASSVPVIGGPGASQYRIGDLRWDATNLRWVVRITKFPTTTAVMGSVTVRAHAATNTEMAAFMNLAVTNETATDSLATETAPIGWSAASGTSERLVIPPAPKTLVDATATGLFKVALASGAMAGGIVEYTIEASDGTNHQTLSGTVRFSAVNKAGVYTTNITEDANPSTSVSSGTLVDTWTITTGTNEITVNLNADTSLTATTLRVTYTLHNNSAQRVTLL